MLVAVLRFFGELLLRLYPRSFREAFAEEMREVFREALEDASREGILPLLGVGLRELLHAPRVILKILMDRPEMKIRGSAGGDREFEPQEPDIDPPGPDGRQLWRQAALEMISFLASGATLVLLTYVPSLSPEPGWQRLPGALGAAMLALPLPAFLWGMARGMPRWAYPLGGMLLVYCIYAAVQLGLGMYSLGLLVATIGLGYAAWRVNASVRPLPRCIRQVFHSVQVDWTRLSFGWYGGTPLLVLIAYDNGILDNRGPYLAISVMLMAAGALAYIRQKSAARQILALVGGMSLSFWAALLDMASFNGGLPGWMDAGWMLPVWSAALAILLLPVWIKLVKPGLAGPSREEWEEEHDARDHHLAEHPSARADTAGGFPHPACQPGRERRARPAVLPIGNWRCLRSGPFRLRDHRRPG